MVGDAEGVCVRGDEVDCSLIWDDSSFPWLKLSAVSTASDFCFFLAFFSVLGAS